MKFNINNKVRVKLTDKGRQVHRQNHNDLFKGLPFAPYEYRAPKEDTDGWSEWQLWELMHEFGQACYNGGKVPFETEIEIPELISVG